MCKVARGRCRALLPCVRVAPRSARAEAIRLCDSPTDGSDTIAFQVTPRGCPSKALISLGHTSAARLGGVPNVNDNVTHLVVNCQRHLKKFCGVARLRRVRLSAARLRS